MLFGSSKIDAIKFNVQKNAIVNFTLKPNEGTNNQKEIPIRFLSNISVEGGGKVNFHTTSNRSGGGVQLSMNSINVSGGSSLL